jgi:AAA15 family ATPase/GTPase
MLIEFQVQNFRSFKERQTFSMVGASLSEHVKSNTFDSGLRGLDRLLRTAVVYGPNAAGKTNLMRALQFMQSFVLTSAQTSTAAQYPYRPFKLSKATCEATSQFEITFVQDGSRYEYGFHMGPKQIEREWLVQHVESPKRTRSRAMFERTFDRKKKDYNWDFGPFFKGQRNTWVQSTRDDALFLSVATQLNSVQLRPVFEWFQKKLVAIVGPTKMNQSLTLKLWEEPGGKGRLLPFLKEADLGIVDIQIQKEPIPLAGEVAIRGVMLDQRFGAPTPDIVRVTMSHLSDDPKTPAIFDFEDESSGTQILFLTAGAWLNVIANGEVLLFDEIDTNMHPSLLLFLIKRFHSEHTNPNNAQLICTTHNTSLLDRDMFRRDQFWFVEKQKTGASKLYPLTYFHPRNDEAIEQWYKRGRYGAIPILPISPR